MKLPVAPIFLPLACPSVATDEVVSDWKLPSSAASDFGQDRLLSGFSNWQHESIHPFGRSPAYRKKWIRKWRWVKRNTTHLFQNVCYIIDWSKCKSNISRSHYLWSHHDNQPRSNCRNIQCNNLCDVMHTNREGNSVLVIWQWCKMGRSIIMSDHLYATAGTLNIRFHARETLTSYFQ